MFSSICNLRDIARLCLAGEPLDDELSRWLGTSLEDFLTQQCRSIDEALGLRFPQGGIPWWREEGIRERDAALRELGESIRDDLSPCAKARQIATLSTRYAASAWRFDQDRHDMPGHYTGTPKAFLWRAFKSGATMPIGERQLRNILPA